MALQNIKIDSGCEELNRKLKQWIEWDQNNTTLNETKTLIDTKAWNELKKRFLQRLSFGTAGLRGPMHAGFNAMNDLVVIQTAQGLCKYILETFTDKNDRNKGIVIGYDGRHNSKRFAELSACVFINEGLPVWLFSEMVITPFIPFTILQKECIVGIMVTASHNPKEDNGYKVYWANGAQIISPHDKNIQNSILKNLYPLKSSWDLNNLKSDLLKDGFQEIFHSYFKGILSNIPRTFLKINSENDEEFVYTAMHGVGYKFIEKGFHESQLHPVISVVEQQEPDPNFSTVKFPNPEEGKSSLALSIELANKKNANIILANDPDADRLACAEKNQMTGKWKIFTGNELGALLGWWSIQCYLETNPEKSRNNCYLLASTVSSKILKSMAKIEGFQFEETLTGFKWMGNRTSELLKQGNQVLFAYEEAIGFMFSPMVLDKDGVSAACHLATLYCYIKSKYGISLEEKLNELYCKYGFHCTDSSYFLCYEPITIKNIFERLRHFENSSEGSYPSSILNGKYKISSIRDLTTGIDTSQPDRKALLPTSSSTQMITFCFANGAVVTLRTSGTEPKIKYYAEVCGNPNESNENYLREILNETVNAIVDEFLQPKKNNLIERSD